MSYKTDEIIKTIGKGSFGDVYLVINNGCELARKDIKASSSDMSEVHHEIDLLKKLRDRNVVIYKYDFYDKESGIYHIYTEYFAKGDLYNSIKQHRDSRSDFNEKTIISSIRDLVSGLKYIHSQGIIHRDLKPANIFIGIHNELVIGDFGISIKKNVDNSNHLIGTAGYVAPELWTSNPPSYTPASDIFALGCIIYEIYSLNLCYCGNTSAVIRSLIINPKYKPQFHRYTSRNKAIEELIMKMLERDPMKRIKLTEITNFINSNSFAIDNIQETQFIDVNEMTPLQPQQIQSVPIQPPPLSQPSQLPRQVQSQQQMPIQQLQFQPPPLPIPIQQPVYNNPYNQYQITPPPFYIPGQSFQLNYQQQQQTQQQYYMMNQNTVYSNQPTPQPPQPPPNIYHQQQQQQQQQQQYQTKCDEEEDEEEEEEEEESSEEEEETNKRHRNHHHYKHKHKHNHSKSHKSDSNDNEEVERDVRKEKGVKDVSEKDVKSNMKKDIKSEVNSEMRNHLSNICEFYRGNFSFKGRKIIQYLRLDFKDLLDIDFYGDKDFYFPTLNQTTFPFTIDNRSTFNNDDMIKINYENLVETVLNKYGYEAEKYPGIVHSKGFDMFKGRDETIKMFQQIRKSIEDIYNDKRYLDMIDEYIVEQYGSKYENEQPVVENRYERSPIIDYYENERIILGYKIKDLSKLKKDEFRREWNENYYKWIFPTISQEDPSFTFEDLQILKNNKNTKDIYRTVIQKILVLHGIDIKKNQNYNLNKQHSSILINQIERISPFLDLMEDQEYSNMLESIEYSLKGIIDADEAKTVSDFLFFNKPLNGYTITEIEAMTAEQFYEFDIDKYLPWIFPNSIQEYPKVSQEDKHNIDLHSMSIMDITRDIIIKIFLKCGLKILDYSTAITGCNKDWINNYEKLKGLLDKATVFHTETTNNQSILAWLKEVCQNLNDYYLIAMQKNNNISNSYESISDFLSNKTAFYGYKYNDLVNSDQIHFNQYEIDPLLRYIFPLEEDGFLTDEDKKYISDNIHSLTVKSHILYDKIKIRYGVNVNLHNNSINITKYELLQYKNFYIDLFTRITSFFNSIKSNRCDEVQNILNYNLDSDICEEKRILMFYQGETHLTNGYNIHKFFSMSQRECYEFDFNSYLFTLMPIVGQEHPRFTESDKQIFLHDETVKYRYKQIVEKILYHCSLKIDDFSGRITTIISNTFNTPIKDIDKKLLLSQIKESVISIYNDKALPIMIDTYQFHPSVSFYLGGFKVRGKYIHESIEYEYVYFDVKEDINIFLPLLGEGNPAFSYEDIEQFRNNNEMKDRYYKMIIKLLSTMNLIQVNIHSQIIQNDHVNINEDEMRMLIRMRNSLEHIFPYASEYISQLETFISKGINSIY